MRFQEGKARGLICNWKGLRQETATQPQRQVGGDNEDRSPDRELVALEAKEEPCEEGKGADDEEGVWGEVG